MNNQMTDPLESLVNLLAFSSKDWSIDKSDAWMYGIVAGWDNESLNELQVKFDWHDLEVKRLKILHINFKELQKQQQLKQ
jgi:hypothetical protein